MRAAFERLSNGVFETSCAFITFKNTICSLDRGPKLKKKVRRDIEDVDRWHGKVPYIHFSCRGMFDFIEDCGFGC